MMPPPGLQICIQPRVTLTFDLLSHTVDVSWPRPADHLCRHRFIRFKNVVFTSLVTASLGK